MTILYSFSTALFLSIILVPLLIRVASPLQLVDTPTESRKLHTIATPRIGGLGIILAVFFSVGYWLSPKDNMWALCLGSLIIAVFGYLDDRFDLRYQWKFIGQAIATLTAMAGGFVIDAVPFLDSSSTTHWLVYPLTFLFLIGATNAVNLTDGLDGLAAGIVLLSLGLIAALSLEIGNSAVTHVAITIMGGLLGFLRYNTFPARVFMGDTGSQFLGFITACLAIAITNSHNSPYSVVMPLLILGLPIIDTAMVMLIRYYQGRSLFKPDNNHIHFQLRHMNFNHYEAVAILYFVQSFWICVVWICRPASDLALFSLFAAFFILVICTVYLARISKWVYRPVDKPSLHRERRNIWLRKFTWAHLHSYRIIEIGVGVFLVFASMMIEWPSTYMDNIVLTLAILFALILYFSPKAWNPIVLRLITYTSSIFIVYGLLLAEDRHPSINWFIDSYLIILLVILFLAIRFTRKEIFQLDTEDYLVIFVIMVVPFLPFDSITEYDLARITLRLGLLIYACEYLIAPRSKTHAVLNSTAVGSMLLLAL